MRKSTLIALLSVWVAAASGCIGFEHKSSLTEPTAAGNNSMLGSWTSANIIPRPDGCTDFKWDVTEQSATAAKGNFSATCQNDLKLAGTAQGSFTTSATIAWSATANATAPGLTSCEVKLSGTAELLVSSIRIPYSGTTCLGAVSGIEEVRRR